jgi:hypothetical protein
VLVCTVRLVDRHTEGDTLGLVRTVCSVAQTERRKEDAVGTIIAVLDRRTEGRIRGAVYCSVHVMSVNHSLSLCLDHLPLSLISISFLEPLSLLYLTLPTLHLISTHPPLYPFKPLSVPQASGDRRTLRLRRMLSASSEPMSRVMLVCTSIKVTHSPLFLLTILPASFTLNVTLGTLPPSLSLLPSIFYLFFLSIPFIFLPFHLSFFLLHSLFLSLSLSFFSLTTVTCNSLIQYMPSINLFLFFSGQAIVVGMGKKNPNSQKGRERRGKAKK